MAAAREFSKFDSVLTYADGFLNGKVAVKYSITSEIRGAFLPVTYKVARPLTASRCGLYPERGGRIEFVDYGLDTGTANAGKVYPPAVVGHRHCSGAAMPNDKTLWVLGWHDQWIVVDRGANALALTFSDGGTATIGGS
ncbi:MAG: hypothetical protein ACE5F1_05965 [Planctomycetota bacterium]